jgi:hypothetical protein
MVNLWKLKVIMFTIQKIKKINSCDVIFSESVLISREIMNSLESNLSPYSYLLVNDILPALTPPLLVQKPN